MRVSRGQCRRTLNSPPPVDTTNLQLLLEQLPLRENWKLDQKNPHNKGQCWLRWKRQKLLPERGKPPSSFNALQLAGSNLKVWSLPWRSRWSEWECFTTISSFWTQHNWSKCHNNWLYWLLTTVKNTPRKAIGYKGKKKACSWWTHAQIHWFRKQPKIIRKVHSPLVKRDSLDRFWVPLNERWDLSRDRDIGGRHYCDLVLACWHRCWQTPLEFCIWSVSQGSAPPTRAPI